MRAIVVTGFEPFGGDTANPSLELAKAVDGRRFGTCAVRSIILPVEHRAARELVSAALADPEVAAVVHLGRAGGRARVALERVAVNAMDYAIPDNAGERLTGEPCVANGAAAYFSTLPLRTILAALTADGIPAYISYTAGTYLCNQTLYWTLHEAGRRSPTLRAGFIHVPFLPSMVAVHGRDEPSMDLALMLRAVDTAVSVTAASIVDGER
jgi:pyroglutamyl-peptidase